MGQLSRVHDFKPKIFIAAIIFAISLIVLLVYKGTLNNFFLKDDAILINEGYKRGCEAVQMYFYETTDGPRRCVLGMLFKIFGRNPSPYHALMLLMHIINAGFFFLLLLTLLSFIQPRSRIILAAAGSLLFALQYSVHEAVLWLSAIDEILLTFFLMPSLLCFVLSLRTNTARKLFYAAAFLLYMLASITKVATLIFPAILLSYAYIMHRERLSPFKCVLLTLPFFFVSFFHAALFHILSPAVPSRMCYAGILNGHFIFNMIYYLSDYAISLFGIARGPYLSIGAYAHTLGRFISIVELSRAVSVLCVLTMSGLLLASVLSKTGFHGTKKEHPHTASIGEAKKTALFGFLWMTIFFLPFACHVKAPFADNFIERNNLIHWRYLYFSCAGFCLMLACFLLMVQYRVAPLIGHSFAASVVSLFFLSTLLTNGTNVWYVETMYDLEGRHAKYLASVIYRNYKQSPDNSDIYVMGLPQGLVLHQASLTPFSEFLYGKKLHVFWVAPAERMEFCKVLKKNKHSYFLEYTNVGLADTTKWRRTSCHISM